MTGIPKKDHNYIQEGQKSHLDMDLAAGDLVTCAEMKEIEEKAAEGGLSYYQMMENAGMAAADFIMKREPVAGRKISVFCGKGNNGGDGFVVARRIAEAGGVVSLILVDGDPKTEDAIKNKILCEALFIPIIKMTELVEKRNPDQKSTPQNVCMDLTPEGEDCKADIIIDAIYGTGFHGELKEPARKVARIINNSKAVVFALDIPSGLNGDDGTADTDTILADFTIAFHRCKPAHRMKGPQKYCGKVVCVDIGIL